MKSIITIALVLVCSSATAQGFQSNGQFPGNSYAGNNYPGNEARSVNSVTTGVVEDIRRVEIATRNNNGQYVGAGVGAAVGGIAGNRMGTGNGRAIATAVMSAVGGAVGNHVGNRVSNTTREAVELIVRLDSGRTISVTQALDADAASLRPGSRVRLIEGANARVASVSHGY